MGTFLCNNRRGSGALPRFTIANRKFREENITMLVRL